MVLAKKLLVSASFVAGLAGVLFVGGMLVNGAISAVSGHAASRPDLTAANADRLVVQGRNVFRFDTFGDQAASSACTRRSKAPGTAESGRASARSRRSRSG